MNNPSNPLKVIKPNWKVGDQREVPATALDALRGTDAYDSYEQLYRVDGLHWRLEGRISRPDGSTVCLLRCVKE
ncbi:MAG: hypothetical protein HY656_08300 [Acidobacteria bacterium]|nr:hypothetical protein [Acidobacteriota bacterium]